MSRDPSTRALPRIDAAAVRLLWVNDWYDAPIEAVGEHDGVACLLRLADPAALEAGSGVRWLLYPLGDEQLAEHRRWHDAYVRNVGGHWCFHEDPHDVVARPDALGASRLAETFLAEHHDRSPVPLESLVPTGWLDALPIR